jgi:hypothetical protein
MKNGEYGVDPELVVDGGSDWVKCTSIAIYTVVSLMMLVLFSILLAI